MTQSERWSGERRTWSGKTGKIFKSRITTVLKPQIGKGE